MTTEPIQLSEERLRSLKSAGEIADRLGIPETILLNLANEGFIPHYKLRGIEGPWFMWKETRYWIRANLVTRVNGNPLPKTPIIVAPDHIPSARYDAVPFSLQGVEGLREYVPDFFCGVYFLCCDGQVVYVGQSHHIPQRLRQHGDKKFDRVFFLHVPQYCLDELESKFIRLLNPSLNLTGKASTVSL